MGAGTVLKPDAVDSVVAAGGRLIVARNFDPAVVCRARHHGAVALPGVATPTEVFAAFACGANGIKLFPAEAIAPAVVPRAVLPADALVLPVGGIGAHNMAAYLEAGADGFGIGGEIYKPGYRVEDIRLTITGCSRLSYGCHTAGEKRIRSEARGRMHCPSR